MLTPEIKEVITQSAFIPIATVSKDGQPHLIVVGKVKEIQGEDTLVFGVYKMVKTRQNLAETGIMQAVAVVGKKGYRFSGKGTPGEKEVVLKVESVEPLL